jgi:hypothetical protein
MSLRAIISGLIGSAILWALIGLGIWGLVR